MTVKITKVEPQLKDGKLNGYKVTLSDGVNGYLVGKDSDKDLKEGEEVTYTSEVPEGKTYKKITAKRVIQSQQSAPQSPPASTPSTPPPTAGAKPQLTGKNKFDHKVEAAIQALDFVMDAYKAERIDWPKVTELQKECVTLLWQQIDDIYNSK